MDWGLGQVFGSTISGIFGMAGERLRYENEKQLADQQNKYNLDMWRMQNEYNSPAAQMQRFKEAGLNPNLIYGQGSNGNAQSAPHMITPRAADYSSHMAKLGELFNIEGLKEQIAHRKEAQANARAAQVAANEAESQYDAKIAIGSDYELGSNGMYHFRGTNGDPEWRKVPFGSGRYYMAQILANNRAQQYLLDPRAALLGSQNSMLAPQIQMLQYDQKYYPYTFWINNGSRALNAVSNFIPRLPVKFNRPPMQYQPPTKRVTTYY